ncbi:MAG TPA: exodeoxyribonuclease VII large subunit, partial [Prolixibacteraceae bacterium]|nr:exodeoxyribonuclease VII large subunit [Prolixibacteraceae bacterium]
IVRGGGSQMDLNSFDQYELAYHVAQFPLPVLTGIGHEKDDTIVDRVAHTKLKTPTAVAEFLIGKYDEAAERIEEAENDFLQCVNRILNQEKQRIDSTLRLLRPLLKGKMERWSLLLAHRAEEVAPLLADTLEQQRYRLIRISDRLGAQSRETLTRGNNQLKDIRVELTHQTKLIMLDHHKNWTDCKRRLKSRSYFQITKHQDQISWFAKTLSLVDPANILKRGFSITLKNGKALIDARAVEPGDQLEHVLYKGRIRSVVEKQTKPEPGTKPSK